MSTDNLYAAYPGDNCGAKESTATGAPGKRKRLASMFLVLAIVSGGLLASTQGASAAALTNISWAVSNNQAGATANYAFSFKTASTGTIKSITFVLSAGSLGGTPAIVAAYGIGAGSVARSTNTITYTVTSAVSVGTGIPIFIELSGLVNPVAGSYTQAITTRTVAPATIDSGTTPSITFAATNTAKTITVAKSLTFTLDITAYTLNMDPSLPALADQSNTSNITVQTNANSGYTLTVADAATGLQCSCTGNPVLAQVSSGMSTAVAFPSAPASATGYNVTGTGTGDPGFSVNAAFSGSAYAGFNSTGDTVAQSTTATGATANTIAIIDRTAVDYASASGTYTDTITYTATPNYS